MRIILFVIAFTTLSATGQRPDSTWLTTEADFFARIDSLDLEFDKPAGYSDTEVSTNRDLWYEYAILHDSLKYEIRYTIWSLKGTMREYERCEKDPNCSMVHPDNIWSGRAQANVMNMSGGATMEVSYFGKEAVGREFNADAGGTSFFKGSCQFTEGYEYGQFIAIHKNGVATAIVTWLFDDRDMHSDLMLEAFHALKFKED